MDKRAVMSPASPICRCTTDPSVKRHRWRPFVLELQLQLDAEAGQSLGQGTRRRYPHIGMLMASNIGRVVTPKVPGTDRAADAKRCTVTAHTKLAKVQLVGRGEMRRSARATVAW